MKFYMNKIRIGIIDDHAIIRKSLKLMLSTYDSYEVVFDAGNGIEGINGLSQLTPELIPEILLMDVNMPEMNGIEATSILSKKYPSMKIVALSMSDSDEVIVDMIKAGARAYLLKEIHPNQLDDSLQQVYHNDSYFGEKKAADAIRKGLLGFEKAGEETADFTDKELQVLKHMCSDLSYKEIAASLFLSERTIDGYRERLFSKLKVNSRIGLAIESIRKGIVKIETDS